MEKVIATIAKNGAEELRVELINYRGHDLLGFRIWVTLKKTRDVVPTHKGITVAVDLIPQLRAALETAEHEARAAGLLKGGV